MKKLTYKQTVYKFQIKKINNFIYLLIYIKYVLILLVWNKIEELIKFTNREIFSLYKSADKHLTIL